MSDYFLYYTESNLVCLIIFGIMFVHDMVKVDRQEKQIKFDQALVVFMLYFISDILWSAVIAGVLPRNLFTVVLFNFLNYVFMAAFTFKWLEFVMAFEHVRHKNRRINKFAVIFPFFVSTIVLIAVYLFAPQLLIDKELSLHPAYYAFMITVPCIYIAVILIFTIRMAAVEENPIEKKKHLFIGFFPLLLIAGGLFQIVLLPNTPIFCFCCTILMLMLYIHSMEDQISTDPLTKLNNRGQLMRYIAQKNNAGYLKDRLTFVIMIDINEFKKVNDTFGHAEGDRALIILADSLKDLSKTHNMPMFISRYGGDEFVLIVHPETEAELEPMIKAIRKNIETRCRLLKTPYVLSIGAGYDMLQGGEDTVQKCIQRADKKLYLDKAYVKNHAV